MSLMRYRPRGAPADDPKLGRYVPDDWRHVERYPLSELRKADRPKGVPVVVGINWYSNFDEPEYGSGGRRWIGRGSLGHIRGGHAVVLLPPRVEEPDGWYPWYDQIAEGICVSEAIARCMALLNRKRYQPRPLYDVAQTIDEWQGEDYEGTSVRAGLEVARTIGLVAAKRGEPHRVLRGQVARNPEPTEGIAAYRWATSVEEVAGVLGLEGRDYVTIANSWGRSYPRRVRMPLETLDRLRAEDGEIGLVTDK